MAQQTAIDWYDQELRKCMMGTVPCDPIQIREQANQMFQEQIESAFSAGSWYSIGKEINSEQYYKETYTKKSTWTTSKKDKAFMRS